MNLANPLTHDQIAAASELRQLMPGWLRTDNALDLLADRLPKFTPETTLLKAVAVNALYRTNVWAIVRATEHVHAVLTQAAVTTVGPELVEDMARVPTAADHSKTIRLHSFAAKFAHFFIDCDRFPILDSFAEEMVRFHLGPEIAVGDNDRRYVAFRQNLDRLRDSLPGRVSTRELDRYLWVSGQYRQWKEKPDDSMNAELRRVFESEAAELDRLA